MEVASSVKQCNQYGSSVCELVLASVTHKHKPETLTMGLINPFVHTLIFIHVTIQEFTAHLRELRTL